jgi:hypothetical protein
LIAILMSPEALRDLPPRRASVTATFGLAAIMI